MTHGRAEIPQELKPREREELKLPNGSSLSVGVARPEFKQWQGAPIANTFGGKPLVDTGGAAEFAELAILRCFERSGWEGRWIETYGASDSQPFSLTRWEDCKLSEQPQLAIDDPDAQRLLDRIAERAGGFGGCWDVFAWKDGRYVFSEAKRSGKDAIRDTQLGWLAAAVAEGCDASDFLLVEWSFLGA